ncbi:hypothetical protein Q9233_002426 [Columba guinea]|nr:hypothetical protein Q9233_002426 [Columba guinea]
MRALGLLLLLALAAAGGGSAELGGQPAKRLRMAYATGPLLKFQIWRVFEEYMRVISQRYPDIRIEGENYLPQPIYRHIASFLSVFKLVLIGLIIVGKDPFAFFGMQAPSIWQWGQENKNILGHDRLCLVDKYPYNRLHPMLVPRYGSKPCECALVHEKGITAVLVVEGDAVLLNVASFHPEAPVHVYACMMVFFLSNMIENQCMSTGAFEITLNDVPVWSKLESGHLPSMQQLVQILDNEMKLNVHMESMPHHRS